MNSATSGSNAFEVEANEYIPLDPLFSEVFGEELAPPVENQEIIRADETKACPLNPDDREDCEACQ